MRRYRRDVAAAAARLVDLSIVVTATLGLWLLWSQYSYLWDRSWWYENTQRLRSGPVDAKPDYDLTTLPWQIARSRVFRINQGELTVITGSEPFAYQAYATVATAGARAADVQFDGELESGGATIGLQQGGKWIAVNSAERSGPFSDSNSARLGFGKSVTVVVANDNPAGESRLVVKSLRLFFRK